MTDPLFDLTGQVALITGSSRGLGKATARVLAERGACVITNTPLTRDRDFRFKLSFYRAGMLAARGRVVWSSERKKPGSETAVVFNGVEFDITSTTERQRLLSILQTSEFKTAAD